MQPKVYNWPAPDRDGICLAQQTTGAGSLAISGALSSVRAPDKNPFVRWAQTPGLMRTVSLYSAGDLSTVNVTVAGLDWNFAAVTETTAGPNATTKYTTATFQYITSVTVDAAVGTDIEIGTGTTGYTDPWLLSNRVDPANVGLFIDVTGTINVTVRYTPDAPLPSSPTWFNHPFMTSLTADTQGNLAFPCSYAETLINSSSSDGAVKFTVIQAGDGV